MPPPFEIICVDDSSNDQTWSCLTHHFGKTNLNYRLIRLASNVGQHNATLIGLKFVKGDWAMTLDDDMLDVLTFLPDMIHLFEQNENEVLYGFFIKQYPEWWRNFGSRMAQIVFSRFLGTYAQASQIRLLSRKVLSRLEGVDPNNFVFLEVELTKITRAISHTIIDRYEERETRYSFLKLVNLIIQAVQFYKFQLKTQSKKVQIAEIHD